MKFPKTEMQNGKQNITRIGKSFKSEEKLSKLEQLKKLYSCNSTCKANCQEIQRKMRMEMIKAMSVTAPIMDSRSKTREIMKAMSKTADVDSRSKTKNEEKYSEKKSYTSKNTKSSIENSKKLGKKMREKTRIPKNTLKNI